MADESLTERMRRLIEESRRGTATEPDTDALLFLGNWHDSIPRALTLDPVLEAVDVRVYLLIRICLSAQGLSRFPSYDEIQRLLRLSRPTVARCILILRAARWISLCNCLRDESGRFKGNVYAVHDEVLPLGDTIALDGSYLEFLEGLESHHHPRVAMVAHAVLETVRHRIRRQEDLTASRSPVMRFTHGEEDWYAAHPERIRRIHQRPDSADPVQNSNSAALVKELNSDARRRVQSLNLDENPPENQRLSGAGKKLNSVLCSSSLNKKTATTFHAPEDSTNSAHAREPIDPALIFPSGFSDDERRLAWEYLRPLTGADRQALLDELAAQIHAKRETDKPIRNALGYLHWMCGRLAEGQSPLTSLGLKYRQLRERERQRNEKDLARNQTFGQTAGQSAHLLTQRLSTIHDKWVAQKGKND